MNRKRIDKIDSLGSMHGRSETHVRAWDDKPKYCPTCGNCGTWIFSELLTDELGIRYKVYYCDECGHKLIRIGVKL